MVLSAPSLRQAQDRLQPNPPVEGEGIFGLCLHFSLLPWGEGTDWLGTADVGLGLNRVDRMWCVCGDAGVLGRGVPVDVFWVFTPIAGHTFAKGRVFLRRGGKGGFGCPHPNPLPGGEGAFVLLSRGKGCFVGQVLRQGQDERMKQQVVRQVHHERDFHPHPSLPPSRGKGGFGCPHPNPLPGGEGAFVLLSRGKGCFVGQVLRQAQDERKKQQVPSTGSGRTRFSPPSQPSPIKGEGAFVLTFRERGL